MLCVYIYANVYIYTYIYTIKYKKYIACVSLYYEFTVVYMCAWVALGMFPPFRLD